MTINVLVWQRKNISFFVQGVSFTPVTASSSQTSTGEGAATDEESNIIKVHQMFPCGSFSIRRDNSCKNEGNLFLFCKLHLFLNLIEPRTKNQKLKFRKNGLANLVSDLTKKIALLAVKVGRLNYYFLCKWRFANLYTHFSLHFKHYFFFTISRVFPITSLLPVDKIWAHMTGFLCQNINF